MISTFVFETRYSETDQMGIVHHSNYPIWFELGRNNHLQLLGINYKEIEKDNILFPVLEVYVKYRKACYFGDTLKIDTKISHLSKAKVKFEYTIYSKMSSVKIIHAEGYTIHGFTNNSLLPINLKEYSEYYYNKLVASLE